MSLLTLFRTLTGFFHIYSGKRRVFCLFFPAVLLISCGLPSYSYLYPPTDVYSRDDPSSTANEQDLIFTNAYENNLSIFSGYEVYYKIYDPLDSSTSGTQYLTDIATMTNTTGADYNTLNSNGFSRLFFTTDDLTGGSFSHDASKPAFKPDSALLDQNYQIRFKLLQDASPTYLAEPYSTAVTFSSNPNIYRWVYDESGGQTVYTQKQFGLNSFDVYDSDLPETVTSADLGTSDYYFYISFYIFSFGRDADDITSLVYSLPVYLGTLKFDCVLTDSY